MSTDDEDRFRARPGRSRDGTGRAIRAPRRFTSQVLKAAGVNRGGAALGRSARRGAERGRGRVAAAVLRSRAKATNRRVVAKARLVNLRKATPGSTARHVRYIERDGVTRDGQPGQAYGRDTDHADSAAFAKRSEGDRHQFRFILSAEDAEDIDDLRGFIRETMARMETDLGTRLDWIAVDHWDTDNPHSHVALRGVDERGDDLVIARDYISHGVRLRAGEIATEWLGPRTEQEMRHSIESEVDQERWTSLDRKLSDMQARDGEIVLPTGNGDVARFQRRTLGARLQTLDRLGLVDQLRPGAWRLQDKAEPTLRAMGERGDIIRTMQRAFSGQSRPFETFSAGTVIGKVARKGLADELEDRGYLVVDGIDGKAHYVVLPPQSDLDHFREGGMVTVSAVPPAPRPADRTIAGLADADGVYHVDRHRVVAAAQARGADDPDAYVAAHVRRLEALRRIGAAERLDGSRWRLANDFLDRAAAYEAGRFGGVRVDPVSDLPVARQARAVGVTWLDRALLNGQTPAAAGFGAEAAAALDERRAFLTEQGLAETSNGRTRYVRNLLDRLRAWDMDTTAAQLESETGLVHRPIGDGENVRGVYRRNVQLVSGRFAMLDDGVGFSLVPWRPVLEQRLGQTVAGVMRGGSVSWDFGRSRGPAI